MRLISSENKITALTNILAARQYIVILERKYFPLWLLQCESLTRFWKWVLALKFGLSADIAVIMSKAKGKQESPESLASTIVKIYGEANIPAHPEVKDLSHMDEAQWNKLYNMLKIEEDDRMRFRLLIQPVTMKDREKYQCSYNLSSKELDYVFEVKFLENRPMDGAIIRNIFSPHSSRIDNVLFLKNHQQEITNRVFIFCHRLTFKLLEEITKTVRGHSSITEVQYKVAQE